MCLSGESSDAIIFRKSRIKFPETYCTKLLIPRILLFRHKDLKSLSRERTFPRENPKLPDRRTKIEL